MQINMGTYQTCKYWGYIYRTELIPSIKGYLEIWVRNKPNNCKRYRPKQELNEIQRLKQKIRKLTDKLADAQMESYETDWWREKYYNSKSINGDAIRYIKRKLKKKCGKILSEKDCNELLEILGGLNKCQN